VPKPTADELAEEWRRSAPIGYFNFAETYRTSARALRRSKAESSHKDSPIRFLYYHAIELYMKAHLRLHEVHPYELRTKYGHSAEALRKMLIPLDVAHHSGMISPTIPG
jgi:hypothetical protein